MPEDRWVALAEVARPHGIRGELRLRSFNPESEVLAAMPDVVLELGGTRRKIELDSVRGTGPFPIVKIRGIDDRDRAAELRGALVLVQRDALPPPDEGEFYLVDVMGAEVRTAGGPVGKVVSIATYPAADVLVVECAKPDGAHRVEVPITDAFVESIDLERHEVTLVDGALEQLG